MTPWAARRLLASLFTGLRIGEAPGLTWADIDYHLFDKARHADETREKLAQASGTCSRRRVDIRRYIGPEGARANGLSSWEPLK